MNLFRLFRHLMRSGLSALILAGAAPVFSEETPVPQILFVVGGKGTTGGPECGGQPGRHLECKTEQRASIHNKRETRGNHGWSGKASLLAAEGFALSEREEGPWDQPSPVPFSRMDLSEVDVIVMGSNNSMDYSKADVDALEAFVKKGGGVLFISDANFGPDWTAAMHSDQLFLNRFGLIMNQDFGTYTCERGRDFTEAGKRHPILKGVNRLDGEGVSPISIMDKPPEGVTLEVLVQARNLKTAGGKKRPAGPADGALVVGTVGDGRIAAFFDRNTFFNRNGAGTHLHRFDNATFAGGLYRWLAGGSEDPHRPDRE